MKKILVIIAIGFLTLSCDKSKPEKSYSEITVEKFNRMKSPVILLTKTDSWAGYGVTMTDGDDEVHYFGNMSSFANGIGQNYKVGDTLK